MRIDGTTHSRTRQRMIDFFNNDQSCLVAILSITAAGQGVLEILNKRTWFFTWFFTFKYMH